MKFPRYMMAKTAFTQNGREISRPGDSLCIIAGKDARGDYIGNWVTGFGMMGLRFPALTTRELTDDEVMRYQGTRLSVNGTPIGMIDVAGLNGVELCDSPWDQFGPAAVLLFTVLLLVIAAAWLIARSF